MNLGVVDAPRTTDAFLERLLAPVGPAIGRTVLSEAEKRYGPLFLGVLMGMAAFTLYVGRKVLR